MGALFVQSVVQDLSEALTDATKAAQLAKDAGLPCGALIRSSGHILDLGGSRGNIKPSQPLVAACSLTGPADTNAPVDGLCCLWVLACAIGLSYTCIHGPFTAAKLARALVPSHRSAMPDVQTPVPDVSSQGPGPSTTTPVIIPPGMIYFQLMNFLFF